MKFSILSPIKSGFDILVYISPNFWAVIPLAAAFLVATVAVNVISIPVGCTDANAAGINWLLCRTQPNPLYNLMHRQTDGIYAAWSEYPDADGLWALLGPRPLTSGKRRIDALVKARDLLKAQIEGGRTGAGLKELYDAQRLKSRSPADDCSKAVDKDDITNKALIGAKIAYCTKKLQLDAVDAKIAVAWDAINKAVTATATEARARVGWAVSYGVLVTVSLIVAFAAFAYIVQALTGHSLSDGKIAELNVRGVSDRSNPLLFLDPKTTRARVWNGTVEHVVWNVLVFLVVAVLLVIAAVVLDHFAVASFHEHPDNSISLLDFAQAQNPLFNDEIFNWLSGEQARFAWLVASGTRMLGVAVITVCVLAASSLYQTPRDKAFRNSGGPDTPPPAWSPQAAVDTYRATRAANQTYERYLGRSFGRLKMAIYLGAALLVVTLMELTAQFAWGLSLLPPSGDAVASAATKALADFGQTMTVEIGLSFTLFLAALYFPAAVILRERARDYWRPRHPNETLDDQDKGLKSMGLTLDFGSSYTQLFALIAPALSTVVGPILGLFG